MLTGRLPFTASDPMEWVHCHIAKQPVHPKERVESVPDMVSAIIMKLLAKTAEERYQTPAGVEKDLRRCFADWQTHGSIDSFPLGEDDIPDRLLIPEKLYGRQTEIDTLLTTFDRVVAGGRPELVLVSGYSGIGKSAVVNELHKPLVPPRGLFASGKFDQYKRDIPYATLAQAFQALVRPLLGKSDAELSKWRDTFHGALDPNGQLMVDLVPELGHIIGEQPPIPELPPRDAQGRFQLVIRRFIEVFAQPEHPLALFLDDVQWLDAATLDLLEHLLVRTDMKNLLLIAAYRNNEVNATHPLIVKLSAMRQAGAILQDIVLAPLTVEDVQQLLGDATHQEPERTATLAQLIRDKTGGNPFFAIHFIADLAEEGLLFFDHGDARWIWDIDRIEAKGYTDNVVDLVVAKLHRLSEDTQKVLQQLACMGNTADFELLNAVYHDSNEKVHGQLWEGVQAGLIFRSETSYRFLHDRVQEAAYSLIPKALRASAHLRIGTLLADHTPLEKREEAIFEIVNQLNRGSHLVTSQEERERIAELNQIAGRRAKVSTAYNSALKYLNAGGALLTDECWDRNYNLVFSIEYLLAECELLTADMVAAEDRLSILALRAKSGHDIAVITRLQLTLYTTLDRSDRGVDVCLEYLRRNGTDWSAHPTRAEVMREYEQIWSLVGTRQIEELIDLPLLTDPNLLDVLDVLTEVVTPALFVDENLCSLVICRMVNICLKHGNCDAACFTYVWFAIIAGPRFGNYRDGFRFGQLGYQLVDSRGLTRYRARTYMSFGNIVIPWAKHAKEGRELVRRAFDAAYRVGDLTFAAYSCNEIITNMLTVGDHLSVVQTEAENGLSFAKRAGFGLVVGFISAQVGLIRTLRGLTPTFGCFTDEKFDELQFEDYLAQNPVLRICEFWYCARKTQARFLAADYATAVEATSKASQLLWTSPSQFETAEFCFYGALSHAASWDLASPERKHQHLEALNVHVKQLEIWAEHCPENFRNRAALVGAEIARIEGRTLDAERLYEEALRTSKIGGFIHIEALANELAARFYNARGFDKIAHTYLRDARYGYLCWGAEGKVRQLDQLYPTLERGSFATTGTIVAPVEHLDLASVMKVSEVISGELVQEKLIDGLLRIAIEHTGAQRCLLILVQGDGYQIKAEATVSCGSINVEPHHRNVTSTDLPEFVLHYVARTKERILLNDATGSNPFSDDAYIQGSRPRALLCKPLLRQNRIIGVLYLENSLAPDVFTGDRIAILKLLASEAAGSLEITRLYGELQEREAKVRRLVDTALDAVLTMDEQGRINDWNPQAEALFGWRRDEVLGELLSEKIIPMRYRVDHEKGLEKFLVSGDGPFLNRLIETTAVNRDGREFPVELSVAAYRLGGVWAFNGFVRDISERKNAEATARASEKRLLEAQMDLAHANRVATMGQLAGSIAHEVNQPIGAVRNNAHAALRFLTANPPNMPEVREALECVVGETYRAGDIIGRIRDQIKKAPPRIESMDVNNAVEEVLALVRGELSKNGVSVHVRTAEGLSPVKGDRVQLQQVMLNLILNSIEAMASADRSVRKLEITTESHHADALLVAVADSGPGVAENDLERIFESFYTTKASGVGIGLSICRSIIDAHGGRLWAEAHRPRGAVFRFTLPTHN